MLKTFDLKTGYNEIIDITAEVEQAVEESGVQEGTVIVYNPHSTAGLTVFSPWDPAGFMDLDDEIRRLIPTRIDFHHQHDTPQDAAGHLKSALFGVSLSFIIHGGKLLIGSSQKVYFLEFDGPRTRKFQVKVQGD
ncbi:MAG: secondary thiamine-phosphate synthase enzyme YjbQ [Tissierellia bacterium]|nr:secondary thiamine-phosphate synthase enzyme YjbQ [Tissierellia bacterium]